MEEKDFFPLFVNIKNKKILIIGAGKIAYRKAETLLKYGADILVITKEIREEGFKNLNFRLYKDARHELHNEINREEVFGDIRSWFIKNGIKN